MNTKRLQINGSYFLIMLLLFTSVDTVLFGTNSDKVMNYVPRIVSLLAILSTLIHLFINKRKIQLQKFFALFSFCILLTISCLINGAGPGTLLSRVLFVVAAFFITCVYSYDYFFKVFDSFIWIVSIAAIVLEIIAYLFPSLLNLCFIINNTANQNFYSLFISSIMQTTVGTHFIRASGIFWEPGAFSIYLIIAIINQMFIMEKINYKKFVVYTLCIVLTFSTTGLIALLCLLFFYIYCNLNSYERSKKHLNTIILLLLLASLLFLTFGVNTNLYNQIFGKIVNNESTARTRYASIFIPLSIMMDFPLFGVSPVKMGEYMGLYSVTSKYGFQVTNMCTNTITYQFATYGIIYGILFLIGTLKFSSGISKKRLMGFGISLSILLAYCGENFYSFLPYVLIFFGYGKKTRINGELHENCCNQ